MKEWKTYKLGDLINIQSGGTPNKAVTAYWGGNIPWISAKTMYVDFITDSDIHITEEGLKKGSKLAPVGSILLLTRGSGLFNRIPVCLVKESVAYNQDIKCITVKDGSITSNPFLFFWLYSQKDLLSGILETTGIGAGKIDTGRLLDINVKLPDIETQNKFIQFCSSILDKIEINKRINDNLEQQAKALYKSWFVDFEPFKDGDFIESEIGEIPAGWSIVKFSDISETPKKTINPQKFLDTTFCHYSLPACDNGLIPEIQTGKDIMSNKIILQNNTTLFSKLNPRIKRIWFTGEVLPNSICSTEFIAFRAKNDTESSYIFSIVNSEAFYATVMGCVNGATGSHQRFHAEDTEDFLCLYNKDVVNEFSKLIEPILSQMHDLRHENVMLASTRDTLLPRLMSGELKINEIDC